MFSNHTHRFLMTSGCFLESSHHLAHIYAFERYSTEGARYRKTGIVSVRVLFEVDTFIFD